MDDEKFHSWLMGKVNLTTESASDVLSRLRRASKLVDVTQKSETDEIIFRLGQNKEFINFSVTVRSQVRRAVRLYREYLQQRKR